MARYEPDRSLRELVLYVPLRRVCWPEDVMYIIRQT